MKLELSKLIVFNPFMPNVFSHHHQFDESIYNFRVVGWYFSFLFIFYNKSRFANSGEPGQTPASGLVLQYFPMSHKTDILIWVNTCP